MKWSVPGRVAAVEAAAAALFAGAAVLAGEPVGRWVGGLAAVTVAGVALRDVLASTRLAADGEGLTVIRGFAGRRQIPWTEVEAIRVDQRSRLGLSSRLLEVDTGETVHLFSGRELGADPADVAAALHTFSR
ncbi:MAG: PH domain-containing protein [Actinomycetota bacterium]|nr:PH domain-containing protein [Actinomycetota bacterium]